MKQLINKIGVSRILLLIACLGLLLALILTNTKLQAQQKYEQLFYKEDGTVIRAISDLKPGEKHACEYNYGDLVMEVWQRSMPSPMMAHIWCARKKILNDDAYKG